MSDLDNGAPAKRADGVSLRVRTLCHDDCAFSPSWFWAAIFISLGLIARCAFAVMTAAPMVLVP